MPGRLVEYFVGTAYKRLSAVETGKSDNHHQHEFNGVSSMKTILGTERKEFKAAFMWIGQNEEEMAQESGYMTWYNSREGKPRSPEYRLYYKTNFISEHANPGDLMVMGLRPDNTILAIICDSNSPFASWLLYILGFDFDEAGDRFVTHDAAAMDREVSPVMAIILRQLGIDSGRSADENLLDAIQQRFGETFPSTRVFSKFAHETLPESIDISDPDAALIALIDHEEKCFRILERLIVDKRLEEGFVGENRVNDFISYSLQVHNRRKSRAGSALENHMEFLLRERNIHYERGVVTEGRSKPDFLFPGAAAYHDNQFPSKRLTMLGAKTTAKDRWRQILAEANRIPHKHLLTLQADISNNQVDEMDSQNVSLVIPRGVRERYEADLQSKIMCVSDFIEFVAQRQRI